MEIAVRTNIAQVLARMNGYKADVVAKAIPRALNRTGDMARTQTSRVMRSDGYNFTVSEIKQAISIVKASAGRMVTTIKTKRNTKSLMAFSPRQSKAGVTVKVHGKPKLIKGAFIAQRRNGTSGVFVEDKAAGKIVLRFAKQYKRGSRGGWHDFPARKLYGPSVGGAAANARIQDLMGRFISETFSDRLAHEIAYLSR
jgi:hypothetical protein